MGRVLEKMIKSGLLKTGKRVRGMMDGPRKDELISLADLSATQNALSRDKVLTQYIHERVASG